MCNMDELFCILAFPVTVAFAETLGQDAQLSIQWFRDFIGLACHSKAWKLHM